MKAVTIKLQIEKEESKEDALKNFHENITELLHNEIAYESEGIYQKADHQVYVGLQLTDEDLKDLLDAAPGNTFEVIDTHWPNFLKEKTENGGSAFKIKKMNS